MKLGGWVSPLADTVWTFAGEQLKPQHLGVDSSCQSVTWAENYAIDLISILVDCRLNLQTAYDVLRAKILQVYIRHFFKNEVHCRWFLRIIWINSKSRLLAASEKDTDDLPIMETRPSTEPGFYFVNTSQLSNRLFIHSIMMALGRDSVQSPRSKLCPGTQLIPCSTKVC